MKDSGRWTYGRFGVTYPTLGRWVYRAHRRVGRSECSARARVAEAEGHMNTLLEQARAYEHKLRPSDRGHMYVRTLLASPPEP